MNNMKFKLKNNPIYSNIKNYHIKISLSKDTLRYI